MLGVFHVCFLRFVVAFCGIWSDFALCCHRWTHRKQTLLLWFLVTLITVDLLLLLLTHRD